MTKGLKFVNLQKWKHNNPNLAVVKVNVCEKINQIPSIHSQDIEQKKNSDDNQGF